MMAVAVFIQNILLDFVCEIVCTSNILDHPWYCGDGGKRIYTGSSQVSARSVYVLLIASCLSLLGDWVMQLLPIQTSGTSPNPWESFKFYKQKESKRPLAESSRLASFFPQIISCRILIIYDFKNDEVIKNKVEKRKSASILEPRGWGNLPHSVSVTGFTMPSPALPLIRSQFDLEDWQTGLVSSSMSLGGPMFGFGKFRNNLPEQWHKTHGTTLQGIGNAHFDGFLWWQQIRVWPSNAPHINSAVWNLWASSRLSIQTLRIESITSLARWN